jgi:hypothetical protein
VLSGQSFGELVPFDRGFRPIRALIGLAQDPVHLYFLARDYRLHLFDLPLCLFECACGQFPKDIDQLNGIA